MDFRQTISPNPRPSAPAGGTPAAHDNDKPAPAHSPADGNGHAGSLIRVFSVAMLTGIAIILCALAIAFGRGHSNGEAKLVDSGKYQAVFLNNGQVYFGNVSTMNDKYIRLANVYYLTQAASGTGSNSSTNNSYSLVKLGCQQIHDPYDAMVINRSEVSFWENIKDDGKVVASINKFKQQNPNGPDCSQVSTQTQASNSNTTQGTGTTGDTSGTGTTK
jgi:hypothetical protein